MANSFASVGITGAGGNIGQTLQRALADSYSLKLFDRQSLTPVKSGEAVKVDFAERSEVNGIFEGLEAIIHLAGDPSPGDPAQSTHRNNFAATSYVFEEAKRAGVKKVIFASSNFYHEAAIGEYLQQKSKRLILLDDNPTPISLYGQSKVFGENLGRHLSHFGIQFVGLRIGWTVPEDNPALYRGAYMRAVFCSQRDLIQAFSKSLTIEKDFLVAFAVSDNSQAVFDLNQTKKELDFHPQDDAESYF